MLSSLCFFTDAVGGSKDLTFYVIFAVNLITFYAQYCACIVSLGHISLLPFLCTLSKICKLTSYSSD